MKYLILKVEEDYDWGEYTITTPMYITENWEENYPKDYDFEVYEILDNGTIGKKIKNYDDYMETGMCFGYSDYSNEDTYNENEDFVFIKKYPNRTRKEKVPQEVREKLKTIKGERTNILRDSGELYIDDEKNKMFWVYGEYHDNTKHNWI